MIFSTVVKIILLVAALFFSICSIGAHEGKTYAEVDRYVVLTTIFVAALVSLIMSGK